MLTKEKRSKKEKGVNYQNNSSFHFELFPFINTIFISSLSFKDSIKEKKLWSKEWVVPQIEVFFKWIKQNLTIKTLWGHSENAVNIHVWVAICTYLIVAYAKHSLKSDLSIYEIMQILGISAFDKSPLIELLTQVQANQNVKEQLNLFSDIF